MDSDQQFDNIENINDDQVENDHLSIQVAYMDMLRLAREMEKHEAKETNQGQLRFPPRRLTFIHCRDPCDICDKAVHTDEKCIDHRYGWLVCNGCKKNAIPGLVEFWSQTQDQLVEKLGRCENLNVRRSSGEIEGGWFFNGKALWSTNHGDYMVKMYKEIGEDTLEKGVTLSVLLELNNE